MQITKTFRIARPRDQVWAAFQDIPGIAPCLPGAELIGVENVCFGSDYPHPEGMHDPLSFVDELDPLPAAAQAKIMGGNLARIMKVA